MPGESQTPSAAALSMLARRALTVEELRSRLARRGFATDLVDDVVGRLLTSRLLDDPSLAYNHARCRAEEGRVGPYRVERELCARGIDAGLAREAVRAAFGPEALALALRRAIARVGGEHGSPADDPKTRARLVGRLVRRGFPAALVQSTLSEPLGPEDNRFTAISIEDDDDAIP